MTHFHTFNLLIASITGHSLVFHRLNIKDLKEMKVIPGHV